MMTGKMWQRPLKGGRVETYVAVEGNYLHIWADSLTTQDVLSHFEDTARVKLPGTVERKPALHGRRKPVLNQLTLEDMLA